MNSLLESPTSILFGGLTGERRKAYIKQWILTGVIFLILAVVTLVVFLTHPSATGSQRSKEENGLVIFGLVLYGIQILYALVTRETLWQLRWRELRSIRKSNQQNEQDLMSFAEQQEKVKTDDSQ